MKISVALISRDALTGRKTLARSTDPHLVLHVIATLRSNRLLEDDEEDEICDPAFPAEAEQLMARLADRIRQEAAGLLSEVEARSEADGGYSPATNGEAFTGTTP